MIHRLIRFYQQIVFSHPRLLILAFFLLSLVLSPFASNFRLDASSDTLVLENDESLKYFREVVAKYSGDELLILAYTPNGDLFSDEVLTQFSELRGRLLQVKNIKSITSMLDVPLVQSPPVTLAELNGSPQYLLNEKTDRELAKKELTTSELYKDLLVSDDYLTAALVLYLQPDEEVLRLLKKRNELRELKSLQALMPEQQQELKEVTLQHQAKAAVFQQQQSKLIEEVRSIASEYEQDATLFLGGVPMIAVDSMSFIQTDVLVFGSAAIIVIILILAIAFRQLLWVAMPLITCAVTGYLVVCLLGLLNWPISVVSSNFLSLLLIITLSLNIHLVVRYRELRKLQPDAGQPTLMGETVSSKFIPCFYTALTTAVAFASLIVSGIRPVIDFGWIMCLGIAVAVITTFALLPALAVLFRPKSVQQNRDAISKVVLSSAQTLASNIKLSSLGFVVVAIVGIIGMTDLTVENRFIDYFKPDTEIYQGMTEIDSKLGGTTPLDIIIDAPDSFFQRRAEIEAQQAKLDALPADDEFDDFDDFDDGFEDEFADEFEDDLSVKKNLAISSYWYNVDGLKKMKAIHESLDALPETGKVMSLASSMSIFEGLKDAKPMDNIDLGFMYNVLSDSNKQTLFVPYMSEDANQAHINIRVFESLKGLDRNKLIADIRQLLINEHGLDDEQINISGMVVLYNNMLNSLFNSQIMTLGTVFFVILLMFIVLFKNLKLALITIIPNIFSAAVVLGVMGLFSIPLDLMTITIAAISVGIAVDNSIHFVHRFKDELALGKGYASSINIATENIGQAMFYTTLVIASGFLIMVFSNFVPTVYFGILTSLAMVTALIANLVMLPILLSVFRPIKVA